MSFKQTVIVIVVLAIIYFIFDQNAWHTVNDRTFGNVDYTTGRATQSATHAMPLAIIVLGFGLLFIKVFGKKK